MKRLFLLSISLLVLCACSAAPSLPNDYIVMLTPFYPDSTSRCTGFLIDESHIVTANHCTAKGILSRVVTIYGEESNVEIVKQWADKDIALLKTTNPLHASQYATIAAPTHLLPADAMGMCPLYMGLTGRSVTLKESTDILANPGPLKLHVDQWVGLNTICGGDSGGVIVQGGQVVGLINATELFYFFAIGNSAFATSGETINKLICNYDNSFNTCKGES